jgi:signal transduction histidine kinase
VLQILLNLVGNAISYSPDGSTVRVEVAREAGRARAIVSDEGPGIPTEKLESVFDKFERLGRGGDGGSGLGLYISRRLARAMGGDLTASSTLGEGARFTLELPAGD